MNHPFHVRAKLFLITFLLAWMTLSGCNQPRRQLPPLATSHPNLDDPWYQIYFTQPEIPSAETYRGGPDDALVSAIERARLSVDMAAYDLNLWSIRDALLAADRRGVAVRLVIESDKSDQDEIQQLKDAGIPILGDRREGLMHNKFTIIDRNEVWTGSMNYTLSDTYRNNNNLMYLRSSRLAEDYTTEFEEMFVDDRFGPGSPANTPYPELSLDGTKVEVYFSPDDHVLDRLVGLVWSAKESVHFLAYSFTQDELADALLSRHLEGVDVSGVMEARQVASNTGSDYQRFRDAGLDVRVDANPNNMHHKVLIIDERIVVTGSYNFSKNAEERNDENLLVIYDPQIAAQYMQEFQRIFTSASP